MPRTHPPALFTLVRRALTSDLRIAPGTRVLLALSGGGDSQAMAHAVARAAPALGIELVAHGVDHGLRPEAGRELDLAEALARSLGVPFGRTQVAVARGGNLQARARAARTGALERAADAAGASLIATAHHADDRAETLLLRLLHGATPEGLGVLPARDGRRIRPLLRARRADVTAHLARHRIPHASDPSNQDPRFLRTRVRRELLPLLESLDPAIVAHLTALAEELSGLPPPPAVATADAGRLGRTHREALSRARSRGEPAEIWLPGGAALAVDRGGQAQLVRAADPRPPGRRAPRPPGRGPAPG